MKTVGEIVRVARDAEREHEHKPGLLSMTLGSVAESLTGFENSASLRWRRSLGRARPSQRTTRAGVTRLGSKFAEKLPGLDLPVDEDLAADLLAPRYSLDSQGRRAVEPKSDTKRRLRRSPDRGDAVVMAFGRSRQPSPGRTMSPFARRRRQPAPVARTRGISRDPFAGVYRSDTVDSATGLPSYTRGDLEPLHRKLRGGQ